MKRKLINSGSSFEEKIGYSRAVVVGDMIFVSGTTGYDYKYYNHAHSCMYRSMGEVQSF